MFQEKIVTLQKQLDMMLYPRKHKSQKINDKNGSDSTSVTVSQDSPGILFKKRKLMFMASLFTTFLIY